jgi:uncharacterized protein (UPF0303 family)
MPAPTLMEALLKQEQALILPGFDEVTAYDVGSALRAAGLARHAPIVIDIRTAARRLYYTALPGASADNEEWARRKANVVLRCQMSSMRMGLILESKKRPQWPDAALDPKDFAVHGGSFPVRVTGVGVIGAIAVSGLTSREDHDMIVAVLAKRLGLDGLALPE